MLPPAYNACDTLMVPSNPASLGVNAEVGTVAKTQNTGELYYKYGRSATQWVQVSGTTGVLLVPTAHASRHKTGGADVLAIDNATATMSASRRNGCMTVLAPIAAIATNIVGAVLPADGVAVIAAQPDWPRKLQIDVVDADASITAGTLTIVGTDQNGAAATQDFDLTGGTKNLVSTKAYASVTSVTLTGVVGAAGPDTVSVGVTNALGVIGQQIPVASGYAVYLAYKDGVREVVGTVDSTAGTIIPTTAPNAVHNFQFFYTFGVTEVQSAHTHTIS